MTTFATVDANDTTYIIIARAKGKCVLCSKKGADTVTPIVPVSYGGDPAEQQNLMAAHARCAELRHRIEGSSPEPPPEIRDGLTRMLTMPGLRPYVMGVLHHAAHAKHEEGKHYREHDTVRHLEYLIGCFAGWSFLGWTTRPEGLTEADEAWLKTSEAYSAIFDAAYALLPCEG